MVSDWPIVNLGDVAAEITVGHVGAMASEYQPSGIPFLRSQDIEPYRLNLSDIAHISEGFHARLQKSSLKPGDVVIVRTGKPGTAAVIPESLPIANCSDLVIVRPGTKLDSRFLVYYVNSLGNRHVASHLVGAVQQHFSEELVETVDTALVTLKSFERGGGYKADGLKGFSGPFKPEQEVKPGEIVIALTDVTQKAEVIGRPALVRKSSKFSKLVASLDTAIVRPRKIVGSHFLYCLFRTPEFADHTYAHCSGTTVLHLGKEAIPSFVFPKPEERDASHFEQLVTPMFDRITHNELENTNLTAVRDALLPKLLSGEIRLKQAEEIVDAHA